MKNNADKKLNPLISFLLLIVIPIVIAVSIISVILSFAGFNVIDWTKEKTISMLHIKSDAVLNEGKEKQNIQEAQNKIEEQRVKVEELEAEILFLEGIIEQLDNEILQAKNGEESTKEETSSQDASPENKTEDNLVKEMAASFTTMRNKQAAKIMEKLSEEVALSILTELSKDTRGNILGSMDPTLAAKLTTGFINGP